MFVSKDFECWLSKALFERIEKSWKSLNLNYISVNSFQFVIQ